MEREKMIEEMIRDYYRYDEFIPSADLQESIKKGGYINIVNLYDVGYRKIPEGAVVLTRKEYQKYCAYKIIEPQIKGCMDRERKLEKQLEQARKEAVREVLKKVDEESNGQTIMVTNYIRKKYGVEVE